MNSAWRLIVSLLLCCAAVGFLITYWEITRVNAQLAVLWGNQQMHSQKLIQVFKVK